MILTDEAERTFRAALTPAMDKLRDHFPDARIDFSYGLFAGNYEPTIYMVLDNLTNDDLNDAIYKISRIADQDFRQSAVIFYDQYPIGRIGEAVFGHDTELPGILKFRYEPMASITFPQPLTNQQVLDIHRLVRENNLSGLTVSADRKTIEMVNISAFGEENDWERFSRSAGRFAEQIRQTFNIEGSTSIIRKGAARVWVVGSDTALATRGGHTYQNIASSYSALRGEATAARLNQELSSVPYLPRFAHLPPEEISRVIAAERLARARPQIAAELRAYQGGIPSPARVIFEQREGLRAFAEQIGERISLNALAGIY